MKWETRTKKEMKVKKEEMIKLNQFINTNPFGHYISRINAPRQIPEWDDANKVPAIFHVEQSRGVLDIHVDPIHLRVTPERPEDGAGDNDGHFCKMQILLNIQVLLIFSFYKQQGPLRANSYNLCLLGPPRGLMHTIGAPRGLIHTFGAPKNPRGPI